MSIGPILTQLSIPPSAMMDRVSSAYPIPIVLHSPLMECDKTWLIWPKLRVYDVSRQLESNMSVSDPMKFHVRMRSPRPNGGHVTGNHFCTSAMIWQHKMQCFGCETVFMSFAAVWDTIPILWDPSSSTYTSAMMARGPHKVMYCIECNQCTANRTFTFPYA